MTVETQSSFTTRYQCDFCKSYYKELTYTDRRELPSPPIGSITHVSIYRHDGTHTEYSEICDDCRRNIQDMIKT